MNDSPSDSRKMTTHLVNITISYMILLAISISSDLNDVLRIGKMWNVSSIKKVWISDGNKSF